MNGSDLIERLAWPVNPNAPEDEVILPAWVLELCAEASGAIEAAQAERDAVWAEATAAAYGAASELADKDVNEGGMARSMAFFLRAEDHKAFIDACEVYSSKIEAITPQSARDWLAEREAATRADERTKVMEEAEAKAWSPFGNCRYEGSVVSISDLRAISIKEKDNG